MRVSLAKRRQASVERLELDGAAAEHQGDVGEAAAEHQSDVGEAAAGIAAGHPESPTSSGGACLSL